MIHFQIAWLLCYISIASFSAAIITPALPQIEHYYRLGDGQVEWLVSVFLIGYVLGQLVYGPLANRFGRVSALRLGLVINIIGLVICLLGFYLYDVYSILIIGRFITALGAASGLACTFMLINEWLPEEYRRTAVAYSILSFTLGNGIAVLFGGLISEYLHWQYCFHLLLFHGVVMLVGTRMFQETLATPKPINMHSILCGYQSVLKSKTLVGYSLVVGLCSSIGYCFSTAAPLIATHVFKLTPAEYGYWNSLNVIGMLAGGISAKYLLHQLNARILSMLGIVGVFVGLFSLLVMALVQSASPLWYFITSLSLYLFSAYLFTGGSYIASNAVTDKASGAAMMSFLNMATATMAVVIMGYVSQNPFNAFEITIGGLWVIAVVIVNRLKLD